MPISLTMPRLSDTMEVGTVIKWNVKEGDKVRSGDVLADIETDKATMEMQCFDDGTVAKIVVEAGKQVKVGTLIALLAGKGEDPATVKEPSGAAATAAETPSEKPASPATKQPTVKRPEPAPSETPKPAPPNPAPPNPAPVEAQPADADAESGRVRVSPVARRMAEDAGVDVRAIKGSGPGGRVIKRDVQAAAANVQSAFLAAADSLTTSSSSPM